MATLTKHHQLLFPTVSSIKLQVLLSTTMLLEFQILTQLYSKLIKLDSQISVEQIQLLVALILVLNLTSQFSISFYIPQAT